MTINVTTKKQTNIDSVKNQATKLEGCDKIISEHFTGNTRELPKRNKLMNQQLHVGDKLIGTKWNRLARNLNKGINAIKQLSTKIMTDAAAKTTADLTNETPAKYNDHQFDYAMKLLAEEKSYTEIERKTTIDKATLMLLLPGIFRI